MAEQYRGLTIRFGANANGLFRVLRSTRQAIQQTQGELNRLKSAFKFGHSDIGTATQQLKILGDKGVATGAQLSRLRTSLAEVGQQIVTVGGKSVTLKSMSEYTKDAATAAMYANDQYQLVNGELEVLHRELNAVYKKMHPNDKTPLFNKDRDSIRAAITEMRELGYITDEQVHHLEMLRKQNRRVSEEYSLAKLRMEYRDLGTEVERAAALMRQVASEQVDGWLSSISTAKRYEGELEILNRKQRELSEASKAMAQAIGSGVRGESLTSSYKVAREYADSLRESIRQTTKMQEQLNREIHEMGGFKPGVEGRYDEIKVSLKEVTTQLRIAEGNVRELANEYNTLKATTSNWTADSVRELMALRNQLVIATGKVRELEQQEKKLKADAALAQKIDEYRRASVQIDTMRGKLAALGFTFKDAGGRVKQFIASIRDTAASVRMATGNMNAMSTSLKSLGISLMSLITNNFYMVGFYAINAADEIDSAFRNMVKTVEATDEQLNTLREDALKMSTQSVVSADELLNIEAMGGQLGIAVSELENFATVAANLSIATNISTDDISEQMGQLAGIVGDAEFNFVSFGDALTRLGNNAPALEDHIMQIVMRLASVGTICDMTVPQIMGWSTALAATGQGSEAAGTALAKTMSAIEQAVGQAGDKLNGFAEVAGMSSESFAEMWNTNASGALQAFVNGLHRLDLEGKSVDATLVSLGINGVRQKQALSALAQTTGQLSGFIDMADDAWNGMSTTLADGTVIAAGDAMREAERKSMGFSGTLQKLKNNLQVLADTLIEATTPVLQKANEIITKITAAFNEMGDGAKLAIDKVIIGLVLIGPALAGIGTMTITIKAIVKNLSIFGARLKLLKPALADVGAAIYILGDDFNKAHPKIGQFNTTIGAFAKKIAGFMPLVAIVGAVVAAIALMVKKYTDHVKLQKQAEEAISKTNDAIKNNISALNGSRSALNDNSESVKLNKRSWEEVQRSIIDYSDTISEIQSETGKNVYALENARSVIEQYSGQVGLSAEEQGRLRAAIELVNEELGTSYTLTGDYNSIIMDEAGNIDGVTDAIYRQIDALKAKVIAQGITQEIEANNNELDVLGEQMAALTQEQRRYQDILDNMPKGAPGYTQIAEYLADVNEQIDELNGQTMALNEHNDVLFGQLGAISEGADANADAYSRLVSQNYLLINSFSNVEKSATDFADDLRNLGIDTQLIDSLDASQFAMLAADYDGTAQSIVNSLRRMGFDIDTVMDGIAEMMPDASGEVMDALVKAFADGRLNAESTLDDFKNVLKTDFAELADSAGIHGEDAMNAFADSLANGKLSASSTAAEVFAAVYGELSGHEGEVGANATALMDAYNSAIQNGAITAESSAESVSFAVMNELKVTAANAGIIGDEAITAYVDAIQNGNAPEAALEIARNVMDELDIDEQAGIAADRAGNAYASYLGKHAVLAESKASSIASAIEGQLNISQKARLWANHLVENFASGMTEKAELVAAASLSVAKKAADPLQHTVPKYGPLHTDDVWGEHFVQNIANGISRSIPLLESRVGEMVDVMSLIDGSNFDYSNVVDANVIANVPGTILDGNIMAQERSNEMLASAIIGWLDQNLGITIAEYTPTVTDRDMGRLVRRVY